VRHCKLHEREHVRVAKVGPPGIWVSVRILGWNTHSGLTREEGILSSVGPPGCALRELLGNIDPNH